MENISGLSSTKTNALIIIKIFHLLLKKLHSTLEHWFYKLTPDLPVLKVEYL